MTILILEIPHRGDPTTWRATDEADYIARTTAAHDRRMRDGPLWLAQTPREMLTDAGFPSLSAPADPDDDDPAWAAIRVLAEAHGADTRLYTDSETYPEWQTTPIDELAACDAWNGSDLSGFYRVRTMHECDATLALLESADAPRVGSCGPLRAAKALRRAAIEEGWIDFGDWPEVHCKIPETESRHD
jgi:hypothetical protein